MKHYIALWAILYSICMIIAVGIWIVFSVEITGRQALELMALIAILLVVSIAKCNPTP